MEPSNSHNVYILGAGFSIEAGYPGVVNFLESMRDAYDWFVDKGRPEELEAIAKVLKFRLNSAAAAYWVQMDLENIEELFSLAAASEEDLNRSIRRAIAATLEFAKETAVAPLTAISFSSDDARTMIEPWTRGRDPHNHGRFQIESYRLWVANLLDMFSNGAPSGKNTFITFNYDTLLEETLAALGIPFSYELGSNEATFAKDAPGQDGSANVSIIKIHGSVNWLLQESDKRTRIFPSYEELRKAGDYAPQLIPPTWKKGYGTLSSAVMRKAAMHLETATRVAVIGFSLPPTDVHFKYMLAAGLAKNASLRKIWFINPKSDELKTRAEAHFKKQYVDENRVSFHKLKLSEMAHDMNLLSSMGRLRKVNSRYTYYR